MLRRAFAHRVVLLVASTLFGACSLIPKSGPSTGAIEAGQAICSIPPALAAASGPIGAPTEPVDFRYQLIRVTPHVVGELARSAHVTLSDAFTDRRPRANIRFGPGDVISVTIYASGGGLQPKDDKSPSGNSVSLTDQSVDADGNITVPYAGSIHAAGLTPKQIEETIKQRLGNRFLEPDVVVTLREQRATQVTVLGEVTRPNKFPVNPAGDRILDIIARAEGLRGQGFETSVTLIRHGKSATVNFDKIVNEPKNNIYVWPGDTIMVRRDSPSFVAYGAVGSSVMGIFNSGPSGGTGLNFKFDNQGLSLVEALSKAYSLEDSLANPAAVFIYRFERREVLERMGIDVSCWHSPVVPVIYNVDFAKGNGFFLARGFPMQDKDILYVDNAAAVDITKFLALLQTAFGTATSVP
jgi:polysaccharide biosynthesis/export protein